MAYSFWASMMMRVESWVDAVEGDAPTMDRKDLTDIWGQLCGVWIKLQNERRGTDNEKDRRRRGIL